MTAPRLTIVKVAVLAGGALASFGLGAAIAGPHFSSTTAAAVTTTPSGLDAGLGRHHGGGFAGLGAGGVLKQLAADTGETPMQIVADLRAGKTLDDVANANGRNMGGKVRADALAAVKSELDKGVTAKVITADQEARLLADAKDAIDVAMTAHPGGLLQGLGAGRGHDAVPGAAGGSTPAA